jgi:hypothetical protein
MARLDHETDWNWQMIDFSEANTKDKSAKIIVKNVFLIFTQIVKRGIQPFDFTRQQI